MSFSKSNYKIVSLKARAKAILCQCTVTVTPGMLYVIRASQLLLLVMFLSLGQSKLTGGQFYFTGEGEASIPLEGVRAQQILGSGISMDRLRTMRNENQNVFYLRNNDGKIVKIVRARRGI